LQLSFLKTMAEIIYYSEGKKVSMADSWFEVATLDHFWVKRRFEILKKLLGQGFRPAGPVAEVGCGHGLVQARFCEVYGVPVDGYELNEFALSQSVAKDQPRYIYDIYERREALKGKYGVMIMFDVIEHIEDEKGFLDAVLFHLAPGGLLAVNVPALEWLRSRYDDEQGHFRRYTLQQIEDLGSECGLSRVKSTYWSLPMVPLLLLRKAILKFQKGERAIVKTGFAPPSNLANSILCWLSALEFIPQRLLGTSAMCVFKKT
jgi:SAM-dependent methyltransferase